MIRAVLIVVALLLLPARGWAAEWQVKPFAGATFGGSTSLLIDYDQVAGQPTFAFGVNGGLFGEIFGVEADVGVTPGFFTGGKVVVQSDVITATGNVIVAMPRHIARYGLRPYLVGGGGLMRISATDFLAATPVLAHLGTMDVGGGVTGFFTNRIGITWDVRYFRSVGTSDALAGLSLGQQQLSFWRATTALTIRP